MEKGKIGFGSYRIAEGDPVHEQALRMAIDNGCTLIDTSTNYTNGRSEFLIGRVLKDYENKPTVVTKGGYIQGTNFAILKDLHAKGLALDDLVEISDDLKHSIHPEFLDSQIALSVKRMDVESVDVFLLHNPEYYFEQEGASDEEYYARIGKALFYLENQMLDGRIEAYGISSNTFTVADGKTKATNLEKVLEIVAEKELTGFKYIEFPFNLLEREALKTNASGQNLIEFAHANGIITMNNRPFNAFDHEAGLIRLADYRDWIPDAKDAANVSDIYALLFTGLSESRELSVTDIKNRKGIVTFAKMYDRVDSSQMLEVLFNKYLIPEVREICDDKIPEDIIAVIRELYAAVDRELCIRMSQKAHEIVDAVCERDGIELNKELGLTNALVEYYLSCGIDYVLAGMRHPNYVDQLKDFF